MKKVYYFSLFLTIGLSIFASGGGGEKVVSVDTKEYEKLSPQQKVWTLAQEGRVKELRALLDECKRKGFRIYLSPGSTVPGENRWATPVRIESPLVVAVINDHVEVVRLLLDKGASVNAVNHHNSTVLMLAARFGHAEIIRLLLDRGADITIRDRQGYNPLMIALKYGSFDVIRLFLDKGAVVNESDYYHGMTPLMLAAKIGNAEAVRLLLERGARINAENNDHQTPLMIASENEHVEIVQLIQEKIDSLAGEVVGGGADADVQ